MRKNVDILSISDTAKSDDFFIQCDIDGDVNDVFGTHPKPRKVTDCGFCLCKEGNCVLMIDNFTYTLHSGDMVIVFPQSTLQTLRRSNDFRAHICASCVDILSNIKISNSVRLYMCIYENPCIPLTNIQQQYVAEGCRMLKEASALSSHSFRDEICKSVIISICYYIAGIYGEIEPVAKQLAKLQDLLFRRFRTLLSQDYKISREVGYYADKLCVTPRYLSSSVNNVSGISASTWIANITILNAKLLLANTDMTVHQVACELNFSNQSFFGSYFRARTGKSPKQFREESL